LEIKEGFLPTIQIKNNSLYDSTEWLTTSDWYDKRDKKYYRYTVDNNGNIIEARPEITFTMTDYRLFREHYNIFDFEFTVQCIKGKQKVSRKHCTHHRNIGNYAQKQYCRKQNKNCYIHFLSLQITYGIFHRRGW
jgi:hypothetical protein